jgi:hypothetical protein
MLLLGACGENNKNKNLTVQSSSAGDIKLLKTKTKVWLRSFLINGVT